MRILPLHPELIRYIGERGLVRKYKKQSQFFIESINHPSLETELLEPKHLRIFSFRIDRKYRVIFIFRNSETIEVIDINNHYHR